MAELTFKYANTDLTGATYAARLVNATKAALSKYRASAESYQDRNGGMVTLKGQEPLVISVEWFITGANSTAVAAALEAFNFLLDPDEAQRLDLGFWPDRYWMVKPYSALDMTLIGDGECGAHLKMDFIAEDPHAYSVTLTTITETITASPHTFTVPALQLANGSAPAKPNFRITPSATADSIQVENTTLGTSVLYLSSVTAGHYLDVDSDTKLVKLDGTFAPGYQSACFPVLSPRVANAIVITGVSAGAAVITYRERFKS